jgi:hypothetical protein
MDEENWRGLVALGRSRDGLSQKVIEAATTGARGDPERLHTVAEMSKPVVLDRDPEDEALAAEQERERDALFGEHRAALTEHMADVDAGGVTLSVAAQAYLGRFHDVTSLAEDVYAQLDGFLTPELASRVRAGLVASLGRTDLPTAQQIAEAHARGDVWNIEPVLVAGVAELIRSDRPLSDVPRAALEAAYMAWRRSPESNSEDKMGIEDALAAIVLDTPEAAERFYRTSVEPQLAADNQHLWDLYRLTHLTPLVPLAVRLTREWLQRFPEVRAESVADMMPSALDPIEPAARRDLVIASRSVTHADQDALHMWTAADFLADFADREAELRQEAADDPKMLWRIRTVVQPARGSRLETLSFVQLGFIVEAFATHWPYCDRPDRVTSGDTNPWDATQFIEQCISALAASPDAAAAAMLNKLGRTVASGYENALKHARAQQRRVQTDHDYAPATLEGLSAAVSGALPRSVDDLRAFFADRVDQLQAKLAGNSTDSWVVYWDRDRPHEENYCRNRLVDQISSELPEAISFGPEEQMPGTTRADIALRLDHMVLPVEIKGQWHSAVWQAASAQLDAQYTRDWRADGRGTYLVLWFGDVPGFNLPPHPESAPPPEAPNELRKLLIDKIPLERRSMIDVYVIDVSGTAEGRKRLGVGRTRKRSTKKKAAGAS